MYHYTGDFGSESYITHASVEVSGGVYLDNYSNFDRAQVSLSDDHTWIGISSLESSFTCAISFDGHKSVTGKGILFIDDSIDDPDNLYHQYYFRDLIYRIKSLESKVTELETALANKANVSSPSFTGKVTINPITE